MVKFRGNHRKISGPYRSVQNETHHALLACCCLVLLCLWWGVPCVEFSDCLWCFLGRGPCFCSGEKGGSDRASRFCPSGTPPFWGRLKKRPIWFGMCVWSLGPKYIRTDTTYGVGSVRNVLGLSWRVVLRS